MKVDYCPACMGKAKSNTYDIRSGEATVVCPTCGKFCITSRAEEMMDLDKLASYLYYNAVFDESKNSFRSFFEICYDEKKDSDYRIITNEIIENWYPNTLNEIINYILLYLAKKTRIFGENIIITHDQCLSLFFVKRHDEFGGLFEDEDVYSQLNFVLDYLQKNELVEDYFDPNNPKSDFTFSLTIKGWQRVDELQKNNPDNREVFVAMSFREENKETREAIREGITKAGFSPKFMDEIIHNQQIVPEMFRLIREAKLLILEISDPNYGSYMEAGYAMALGKEVIVCCKQDVFDKQYETPEEKKYERYLKPHFDIIQKQILKWKDKNDLILQLSKWIKAIGS